MSHSGKFCITGRLELEYSLNITQNFLKVNICGPFCVCMLIRTSQILGLNLVHLDDKPSWWWQHPAALRVTRWEFIWAFWYDVATSAGSSIGCWSGLLSLVQLDEGNGKISALFLKSPFNRRRSSESLIGAQTPNHIWFLHQACFFSLVLIFSAFWNKSMCHWSQHDSTFTFSKH